MRQYFRTVMVKAVSAKRYWLAEGEKVVVACDEESLENVKNATACEDGYKLIYPDGYTSWASKDVFESVYRQLDPMNFGAALEAVRAGWKVARKGWNGKEQYVFLAKDLEFRTDADLSAYNCKQVLVHDALAFMGTHGLQVGWLASQADMLGDDWFIVG